MSMIDPYASGVLKPDLHAHLVAELERFAADANIPPARIWTAIKADPAVTADEIAYLADIRSQHLHDRYGIFYEVAGSDRHLLGTMDLMAAWMLREDTSARVAPLAEVLERLADGDVPDETLLLIPDFCLATAAEPLSQRDAAHINRLVIARRAKQRHTVVNAPSLGAVRQVYGPIVATTIKNHYLRVKSSTSLSAFAA